MSERISIDTPRGKLVAELSMDPEYPGIYVFLIDEEGYEYNVALVEWSGSTDLRTLAWGSEQEDYISATTWWRKEGV